MPTGTYPPWEYFPRNVRPPKWVEPLTDAVRVSEPAISTTEKNGPNSNGVLKEISSSLTALGYSVEKSKHAADKIERPVLFGHNGAPEVAYEIDAFHDAEGIAIEVEAGRGASNNTTYRNIVRTSLILDARYLVLILPISYRFHSNGKSYTIRVHERDVSLLSAIYASQRLRLPFEGILLIGY